MILGYPLPNLCIITLYVPVMVSRVNLAAEFIHARAWSATFAWYTTIVAVLTYLSSIIICSLPETHASDPIFLDTTLLPPYPSL